MNGKSGSVHVTLLLNFLSGDQGRLPGGSVERVCGKGRVFRQRGQPGQRFRDQAAFYSFGN